MSQLQVNHSQVTWWGVLVAKQQAGRKPKGLRNRDEQSQRCVCVCVSEGGRVKAGLQIRAASVVIIRCCRKSQRLPLRPVALSLSTPPVFLSVVRCLSLSFKNTPSLALSIHLLCPHRQASFSFEDTHVFFNPSHQITDSP